MNRARALLIVLVASLAPVAGRAAPPDAGSAPASGVYAVNFHVSLGSPIPSGAVITCKAKIAPGLAAFANPGRQPVMEAAETATGFATVRGSFANCAVEIPFSWTMNGVPGGAALSYEVDAASPSGAMRRSAQQGIGVAVPPSGGAANLNFNVTL